MSSRSAPSKQAWQPPSDMYNSTPRAAEAPNPFDQDVPTAMESEIFDKDGHVRVGQRNAKGREPDGCWHKFKKAIWQTKQTEDTKFDRELYIKTTLRELIIYVLFLIVLCIITFGMTSTSMFYFTKVMQELFIESGEEGATFNDMTTMDDFWKFAEEPLLDGLYWEQWYNNEKITDPEKLGFIYYDNKLLGLPRIRMLKVRNDSCTVPDAFKREIKECFEAYNSAFEDKAEFRRANTTLPHAWTYTEASDMDAHEYWGQMATYGAGGFYALLGTNRSDAEKVIQELKMNRWITRGTRAVIIDFTVYNANVNLFCVVKLVVEFLPTGGVLPTSSFRTVKLIRYVSDYDYFILVCEGIFVAFIIYYLIEETIEIIKWRCSYFKDFWNSLDVIVLTIAIACIGFTIYRYVITEQKLDELLNKPNEYANFEFLSYAQSLFNDAIAIMVFFAWVKIFKYISFNKTMSQLSSTLSRSAKDVGGFAIMFFIFFFAYAQLGYLLFGTQVKDFSTFYDAVFTLLRTILGDFDFHELETAQRILGPIFFITYVFFVFFVLLNMFLAIINDTYAEVKAELATQKNEFELQDYFKRAYYNMLRKLNLKKDRIVDVQAVLSGDGKSDGAKTIDFDEWRDQLKKRGYADQEIAAMFVNHDLDADGKLDKAEQKKLMEELQGLTDPEMPQTARSNLLDTARGPGVGRGGVAQEEFNVIARRVDRIEQSITTVVVKIDAAIKKLEGLDRMKMQHRERMGKLVHDIYSSGGSEEEKYARLQQAITHELDRFDNDTGGA